MASTPTTVRMPMRIPIYMKTVYDEYVEIGVIEQYVDVTMEVAKHGRSSGE